MKKLALLFLLIFSTIAYATIDQWAGQDLSGFDQWAGQTLADLDQWAGLDLAGGGPACTTADDSAIWTPVDQSGGNYQTEELKCVKVTIGTTSTITVYLVNACDAGSDTGTVEVSLYNHDAGNDQPDETSQVAGSAISANMSYLDNCTAYTEKEYALASPLEHLSPGTYWLCTDENGGAALQGRKDGSSTGDRSCYSDNGGTTWSCENNNAMDSEVWGCAE